MCCSAGHLLAYDTELGTVRQIPFDAHRAGLELVLVTTHATRALGKGEYAKRRASVELAAALLGLRSLRNTSADDLERLPDPTVRRRARHFVAEISRVQHAVAAIEKDDWYLLGKHMTESHCSLRDLFDASSGQLDLAVEILLASGAARRTLDRGQLLRLRDRVAPTGRSVWRCR